MHLKQVWLSRLLPLLGLPLVGLLLSPAALLFSAPPVAACATTRAPASLDGEEQTMLSMINDYRGRNGLSSLTRSASLTRAALFHSTDMATNHYFSHDDLARGFIQRMNDCGYASSADGENIAAGNADAASTFEQWRTSSGHNANLLGASYRAVGVGRAQSAGGMWYWTADFGPLVDSDSATAGPPPAPPVPAHSTQASPSWLIPPLPPGAAGPGAVAAGSTALVNTPGDCLNARATPSMSASVSACIPDGSPLFLVQGPIVADGHIWWSAFGAGWVASDFLRPGP